MHWVNHLENPTEETRKIKVKWPHPYQKSLGRKRKFVPTPSHHLNFQITVKKIYATKHFAISHHFLF